MSETERKHVLKWKLVMKIMKLMSDNIENVGDEADEDGGGDEENDDSLELQRKAVIIFSLYPLLMYIFLRVAASAKNLQHNSWIFITVWNILPNFSNHVK